MATDLSQAPGSLATLACARCRDERKRLAVRSLLKARGVWAPRCECRCRSPQSERSSRASTADVCCQKSFQRGQIAGLSAVHECIQKLPVLVRVDRGTLLASQA